MAVSARTEFPESSPVLHEALAGLSSAVSANPALSFCATATALAVLGALLGATALYRRR